MIVSEVSVWQLELHLRCTYLSWLNWPKCSFVSYFWVSGPCPLKQRNLVTIEPSRRKVLRCSLQFSTKSGGYQADTLVHNRPVMKVSRIIVPPVTQLLRSKWLDLFSRGTERKIESFWPKNLGQDFFPSHTQLFRSIWVIFSLGALSGKNWVSLT